MRGRYGLPLRRLASLPETMQFAWSPGLTVYQSMSGTFFSLSAKSRIG
jgi:hypothetical protein